MANGQFEGWKTESVDGYLRESCCHSNIKNVVGEGSMFQNEAVDDGNNIIRVFDKENINESRQVAVEIISDILSMIHDKKQSSVHDIDAHSLPLLDGGITDASKVPFACLDIRMKPGYVKPTPIHRLKANKKIEVTSDASNSNVTLPVPGESVIIPDIAKETWREASDEELGKELADKLQEKLDPMIDLVKSMGRHVVLNFFRETQNTEEGGGLLVMNGDRRRTSGGVLFHLLKVSKEEKVKEKFEQYLRDKRLKPEEKIAEQKQRFDKQLSEFLEQRKFLKLNEKRSDKTDNDNDGTTTQRASCESHQPNHDEHGEHIMGHPAHE